ncbi:MAG: hypothetical protein HY300_19570, partial [Verrucomicrobia bacterium]|nr:hypothetical protein [Verrucomicrobiota bacterium]
MRAPPWKRLWRAGRRVFRWCRVAVLLLVLALLCAFLWLNQVGLPDFLKHRIQAELRTRGLDLEFARVRLRWYRGVVAEKVSLTRAGHVAGPQFTVAETEIRLDPATLCHFEIKVPSVFVREGKLVWPVSVSNEPPREVVAENLTTELRFLPDDTWELEKFTALANGIKITLSGSVAHVGELRKRGQALPAETTGGRIETQLRRALDQLDKVKFDSPPEIELSLNANGRSTNGFRADARCLAGGITSPWVSGRNVLMKLRLRRLAGADEPLNADASFKLDDPRAEGFEARHAAITVNCVRIETNITSVPRRFAYKSNWEANLTDAKTKQAQTASLRVSGGASWKTGSEITANLTADAARLKSGWLDSHDAQVTLHLTLTPDGKSFTNAAGGIELHAPQSKWATAEHVKLDYQARPNAGAPTNAAWGAWNTAAPWHLEWTASATNVSATNLALGKVTFAGEWTAPQLKITNFNAELYGGQLDSSVSLDVYTRRAQTKGKGDFDAWQIAPLFGTNFVKFLSQFHFDAPPKFSGEVAVTLPAWTNSALDWKGEVLSSLTLAGHVEGGAGSFRGAGFTATQVDATFSNRVWFLPKIRAFRPEGRAEFAYTEDTRTRDYAFLGRANIDPQAIRPLLEDEQQRRVLDFFHFTTPPALEGEVRGRWLAPDLIGVNASVAATNFTFRGESASEFAAQVNYTNEFFRITDARLARGTEVGTMSFATADLRAQRLFVTNIQSTIDPMAFTRAIGPQAAEAIAPYRFIKPPSARVHGSISFHEIETTDLHFDVS